VSLVLQVLTAEPPLDPSGDEARSLLRRELVHPEYHDRNLVEAAMSWIGRALDGLIDKAAQAPPLSTFAAIVAFLLLGIALTWLLSRVRRAPRATERSGPVVDDTTVTAAELRAAAERALTEGRNAAALVDGFRALTVRQVERGRMDDRPGATAHEVADVLATTYPDQRAAVTGSALLFDAVRYGDRPATREQATEVLALDEALAGRR
jgi:hypothetical protein